jgi:hypothetical protein
MPRPSTSADGRRPKSVTVEHVHVHAGGQAVVGMVETQGGWGSTETRGSTPCTANCPCTSDDGVEREQGGGGRCQSPAMPNGRCRMDRGKSPGAPKDNKNAFKHGRYSAKAVANRREIAMLLRSMKGLARTAE